MGLCWQLSWWRTHLQCRTARFDSWVGKIRWRRDRLTISVYLGFPCGSAGKESAYNAGDLGSIPGLGIPSAEGKGCPLQYFGLENSMDCIVHGGVTKSWTQLSAFHFHHNKGIKVNILETYWHYLLPDSMHWGRHNINIYIPIDYNFTWTLHTMDYNTFH